MSDLNKKAAEYLAQGRVKVKAVVTSGHPTGLFSVAGSLEEPYEVRYLSNWTCDCPARVPVCAHILACQKITNFEPEQQLFTGDDDASKWMQELLEG